MSKERERREQRGEGDDDDETPEGGESVLRVPEDMRVRRQKYTDALWKMYQRAHPSRGRPRRDARRDEEADE